MRLCICAGALVLGLALPACGPSVPDREPRPSTDPLDPLLPAADGRSADPEPDENVANVGGDSKVPTDTFTVSPHSIPGLIAFAQERPHEGTLWIGQLAGNGGRDVAVYVPPDADPGAHFQLIFHFHGTYSERIAKRSAGVPKKAWVGWDRLAQTLDAADELQRSRDYNVVLVYPLSAGKRLEPDHVGWSNRQYDRMWMRPASAPGYTDRFSTLHEEVVGLLQSEFGVRAGRLRRRAVVEGHSAGGIALLTVAETGTKLVGEYIFLDAGFEDWADGCHRAVQDTKSGAKITLVITRGGIADPFGKRDPWCTTSESYAQLFDTHAAWCASNEGTPPGVDVTCEELREVSEAWESKHRSWCASMATDMRDVDDVFVHRTRVPHGKQPRHFTGGLELPPDRFSEGP